MSVHIDEINIQYKIRLRDHPYIECTLLIGETMDMKVLLKAPAATGIENSS